MDGGDASLPARSSFSCCLRRFARPLGSPLRRRLARLGRGEGDALGVQVVHQLGGAQTDSGCLESLVELGENQRLVVEDLRVQLCVRQDEVAYGLEAILEARPPLRGRDANVAV